LLSAFFLYVNLLKMSEASSHRTVPLTEWIEGVGQAAAGIADCFNLYRG
jgi:hypothetical protein